MDEKLNTPGGLAKPSDLLEEVRQLTDGLDVDQREKILEAVRAVADTLPKNSPVTAPNKIDDNFGKKLKAELEIAAKLVYSPTRLKPTVLTTIVMSSAAIILIGMAVKAAMSGSTTSFVATAKNLFSGASGAGFTFAAILTLGAIWLQSKIRDAGDAVDSTLTKTIDILGAIDRPKDDREQ